MEQITVWFDGGYLWVSKAVADRLGLKDNHKATSREEFKEIFKANAEHNIAVCEAMLHPEN